MTRRHKAWTDMSVYVALSMLNATALWMDKIGEVDLSSIRWFSWVGLFIGILTAALLAVKSTMSQSWETAKEPPATKQ